jgi:uncharacterized YigZ family protein
MSSEAYIKTIASPGKIELKEKNSLFISLSFPLSSEKEVQKLLSSAKKEYPNASHYCYAFRLKNGSFRYSDAGEPSGTAGIRIFNAIEHFNLTDLLVIVIRYFGGIKLGVGPLGKAYYEASYQLLKETNIIDLKRYQRVSLQVDFNFISHIHRLAESLSIIIESTEYSDLVLFILLIPDEAFNPFQLSVDKITGGKVNCTPHHEFLFL